MEPCVEIFQPSRLYVRAGWVALAGSLVCILCGFRAPLAFIPGSLCAATGAALFWLGARPTIYVGETQLNIGSRAIAWQELRQINSSRFISPLVLSLRLTNSRKKLLIFPGEPERIDRLLRQLKKRSYLASFDGVAYRDYCTWTSMTALHGDNGAGDQPAKMLSKEDEDEIVRMYQKLKTVGRLDSRKTESKTPDED